MTVPNSSCPLCSSKSCTDFFEDRRRVYSRCADCSLVFVPSHYHLSKTLEKAEYDKHQNSPEDLAYRKFLNRLYQPLLEVLPKKASGLDFGCGPGPALAAMFREQGHAVSLYDPFYADDISVLESKYDFVTATEVIEHLREPGKTLQGVWQLLLPGAYFGVMTKLVINRERFANWHYKNDPTHITFFSYETLQYLAQLWQASLTRTADDAFIFKKG